jgi:solute carrier family 35 protein E3
MENAGKGTFITIFYLVFNTISSIIIVLLNKWVYKYVGFPNLTLTFLHFIVTFGGLILCQTCNVFKVKCVPLKEMIPLAFAFCGFVVFTNLSLQNNTVGTYQVAKVMTTPCIIVIQIFFYDKEFPLRVKLTLVSVLGNLI